MGKRKTPKRKTSADGSKVHVYLLVPIVLYDWLETKAQSGGFNLQDKILDVLRSARDDEIAAHERAA